VSVAVPGVISVGNDPLKSVENTVTGADTAFTENPVLNASVITVARIFFIIVSYIKLLLLNDTPT
jgi:hypothetical protein